MPVSALDPAAPGHKWASLSASWWQLPEEHRPRMSPSSRWEGGVVCRRVVYVWAPLQEKTRPLILRYHGRENLFDWMAQQVSEAVFQNRDVTPYPDFLRQRLRDSKVSCLPPCTQPMLTHLTCACSCS